MKKKILGLLHDKFSFAQMTSNSDGKTSGSGSMGVLVCVVGSFCFLLGAVDKLFIGKDVDLITQSIIFVGIVAADLALVAGVGVVAFAADLAVGAGRCVLGATNEVKAIHRP